VRISSEVKPACNENVKLCCCLNAWWNWCLKLDIDVYGMIRVCGNVRGGTCSRIIASLTDVDNAYTSVYPRFIKDVWNVRNVSCQGCVSLYVRVWVININPLQPVLLRQLTVMKYWTVLIVSRLAWLPVAFIFSRPSTISKSHLSLLYAVVRPFMTIILFPLHFWQEI